MKPLPIIHIGGTGPNPDCPCPACAVARNAFDTYVRIKVQNPAKG